MTTALKAAVHKAEALPEAEQEVAAALLSKKVDELREKVETRTIAHLSEQSFAEDWDNEDDAVYDNWKEIYGVS